LLRRQRKRGPEKKQPNFLEKWMTENSKCVQCGTTEGLSEVRDAKGAWPHGLAGTWCDSCLKAAMEKADQCIRCRSLDVVHYIYDRLGDFPIGLGGPWCDNCFLAAYDAALPKCERCGSNKELIEIKDAASPVQGCFCQYCSRFLLHMLVWSESNEKAAIYLAAFRRWRALTGGGSLIAVQQVAAEVRREVAEA
jgi:hypothetical protein